METKRKKKAPEIKVTPTGRKYIRADGVLYFPKAKYESKTYKAILIPIDGMKEAFVPD